MNDTDEVIEEIRRARCDISRRCGHDIYKYVAYLKQFNARYAEQVERYRALQRPAATANVTPAGGAAR
ncbi:MAG: hypothetical protein NTW87_05020 [Planctomycetota bacterium]|nr:hypothetical protein [Planctomycetota bacterium]